jgi:hypothetical protein
VSAWRRVRKAVLRGFAVADLLASGFSAVQDAGEDEPAA